MSDIIDAEIVSEEVCETSNEPIYGDAVLDEAWHATAKAPSKMYLDGLDVLGAVYRATSRVPAAAAASRPVARVSSSAARPVARVPAAAVERAAVRVPAAVAARKLPASKAVAEAAKKTVPAKPSAADVAKKKAVSRAAVAAGNRAMAAGKKLARRYGRAGNKLMSVGKNLIAKATRIQGEVFGWGDIPSGAIASGVIEAAVQKYTLETAVLNAVALGGEIVNATQPKVDQMKATNPELAAEGQGIIDSIVQTITDFDPQDSSIPGAVTSLKSQADAWVTKAASAPPATSEAPPFDPGTAGGGGGGGGGGGEGGDEGDYGDGGGGDAVSESEAVRRFREEGIDPFDESEESVPSGEGDVPEAEISEADVEEAAEEEAREVESDIAREMEDFYESGESSDELITTDELPGKSVRMKAKKSSIAGLVSDVVLGVVSSMRKPETIGFEWQISDIFMPHQALVRYYREKPEPQDVEFKTRADAPKGSTLKARPASAKRAEAAKKKLEALKRQLSAARAARILASQEEKLKSEATIARLEAEEK